MTSRAPNRSVVKAVVFDKDGVLADSESINLRAAFEVFRAHGYELGPDDEPAIVGKHPIDYVPVLARRFRMSEAEQRRVMLLSDVCRQRACQGWRRLPGGCSRHRRGGLRAGFLSL